MLKCPTCQAEYQPGSRFCMECGAPLPQAEPSAPMQHVSSFGVVQSAMAAQEASRSGSQAVSAPVRTEPSIEASSKLLKVNIGKENNSQSEQSQGENPRKDMQPLSGPTELAMAKRPFSPEPQPVAVDSLPSAPVTAKLVDISKKVAEKVPNPEASKPVSASTAGNNMPNDTGELHQWVERSVAQWSDNASDSVPKAPGQAAPRLANAKPEPSSSEKPGGVSVAAAAPFSAASAAATKVAPPQVASKPTAAPTAVAPQHASSVPPRQTALKPQLTSIAKEEQDRKASKNFLSGLALGCCGGVFLAGIAILVFLMFVGAALSD